jgi:hypothetical protein
MAAGGFTLYPLDLRLAMLSDEPVYRLLGWDGERKTVSAVDGRIVEHIKPERAIAVARLHPNAVRPVIRGTVERDQWSVSGRFDPLRPLYLVSLADTDGTELYISSRNGEIALDTTRRERTWHWLARIDPALDISDPAAQRQRPLAPDRAVDFRHQHGCRGDRFLDRHFADAASSTLSRWRDHAVSRLESLAPHRDAVLSMRLEAPDAYWSPAAPAAGAAGGL